MPPQTHYATSAALNQSKSINNRSSQIHNIINGQPNVYSHAKEPGLLDKQMCNRKKGITEIRDLERGGMNWNADYQVAWKENHNIFKRQNGIFTHLYNAAHRFGETEVFKT